VPNKLFEEGYCMEGLLKLRSKFFIYISSYIRNSEGAVAKSYMRKGFLKYEELRKYFPIYEEAVSHI
jgi:hypothetical protein